MTIWSGEHRVASGIDGRRGTYNVQVTTAANVTAPAG